MWVTGREKGCHTGLYRMVGNFHERYIFALFASQELFTKIKTVKFCCPRRANTSQYGNTLNYLTPVETCQWVCLWRLFLNFLKSGFGPASWKFAPMKITTLYGIVYIGGYYTQKRFHIVTEPALTRVCHDKTSPLYMLPVILCMLV